MMTVTVTMTVTMVMVMAMMMMVMRRRTLNIFPRTYSCDPAQNCELTRCVYPGSRPAEHDAARGPVGAGPGDHFCRVYHRVLLLNG